MPGKQNELARAFEAHRSGNLAAAERQYRAILRSQPGNPDLLYLLGMLSLDTERAANAAGFFDRAIRAARSKGRQIDPEWLLALGAARQRNEDREGALEAYEQALAAAPNSVDAMFCRATALQDLQRTDDAIDAYKNLLDRAPRHAEAAYNFGIVLRDAGKPANAVTALRKAVLLKPDYAEAYAALAPVLEDVGWSEDAIEIYRRAVELTPGDTALAASYSRCLMQANMVEEAERVLRVALTPDPDSFQLLFQLAVLRMFQNDRAEAVRLARRVLAGTDSFPAAHATLAEADTEGDHEAAIREIDEILRRGNLDRETEAALEFACAHRLEYLHRYEEAFDHYDRGNRLKLDGLAERGVGYDREKEANQDRLLVEVSTSEDISGLSGSESELPLFVIGMPRSGTTLVEQILASHPQMAGAGELAAIGNAAKRLGDVQDYPRKVPAETALQRIAERYLQRLRQVDDTALRVVDKLPGNFRYLGLIAMLFPNARVIHCRRDPIDTCLSCYFQNFYSAGLSWSFSLDHLVHQYRRYRSLMDRWREILPLRMLEIDYEQTVADLESQARGLVGFAGLEWDDACLDFHTSKRSVITASHRQVRQPIYSSSVGRWRRYGPGTAPLVEGLAEFYPDGDVLGGLSRVLSS